MKKINKNNSDGRIILSKNHLEVNSSNGDLYTLTLSGGAVPFGSYGWAYDDSVIDLHSKDDKSITFSAKSTIDHAIVSKISFFLPDDVTNFDVCELWISPSATPYSMYPSNTKVYVNDEFEINFTYDKFRGDPMVYYDKSFLKELPPDTVGSKKFKALTSTKSSITKIASVYQHKTYITECNILDPVRDITTMFLDPPEKDAYKNDTYYVILRTEPESIIPEGKWVIDKDSADYIELIDGTVDNVAHIKVKDVLRLDVEKNTYKEFKLKFIGSGFEATHICKPTLCPATSAQLKQPEYSVAVDTPFTINIELSPQNSRFVPNNMDSLWQYDDSCVRINHGKSNDLQSEFKILKPSYTPYEIYYNGPNGKLTALVNTNITPLESVKFDNDTFTKSIGGVLVDGSINYNTFDLHLNYLPLSSIRGGVWSVSHPDKLSILSSDSDGAEFRIIGYCEPSDNVTVSFTPTTNPSLRTECKIITTSIPIESMSPVGYQEVPVVSSGGLFTVEIGFSPINCPFLMTMPIDKQNLPNCIKGKIQLLSGNRSARNPYVMVYTFKNDSYSFDAESDQNYYLYFEAPIFEDDPNPGKQPVSCTFPIKFTGI